MQNRGLCEVLLRWGCVSGVIRWSASGFASLTGCGWGVLLVGPRFCFADVVRVGRFVGWAEFSPRWGCVSGAFRRLGRGFAPLGACE